jgi:hypothetical protein
MYFNTAKIINFMKSTVDRHDSSTYSKYCGILRVDGLATLSGAPDPFATTAGIYLFLILIPNCY